MRPSSLVARLLIVAILVAVASVVGTAWLTSTTAFRFDLQKYGENQAADEHIIDELTGYAATHPTWAHVQPFIDGLSKSTGRRIVVQGSLGTPLADTKPGLDISGNSTGQIDPLTTSYGSRDKPTAGIDPRAVGPYRLAAADRASLDAKAALLAACIDKTGATSISHLPSGRPIVSSDRSEDNCAHGPLAEPVPSEAVALHELLGLVNSCLTIRDAAPIASISTAFVALDSNATAVASPAAAGCMQTGRAEQLRSWVAPPVLASMTDSVGDQRGVFDLTPGSNARIALISAVILTLVIGVTLLIGLPIRRRLRVLTEAAGRVASGEVGVHVPIGGRDELAQLSRAFNEMSRQRERSDRLRDQLNSDVAHELRTPLTNLLGWLEAAEDGVANYDAGLNASLLTETRQLTGIVADLQTLTLADAGGLRLHDDDLDLAGLLAAVVDSHSRRAESDGIALTLTAFEDLSLRGDGGRIRQVLDNLVSNALDHTPSGGSVGILADQVGAFVRIRVEDTGDGISAEDLPSVFERFWRADRSRSRVSGGSGLGLSIVRKLVEAHGGRVTVESEVGRGSVFTVLLPAADARTSEAP